MKSITHIIPVLLIATLFACSKGIVSHSYKAKGVELKQYKTFAWVNLWLLTKGYS